MRNPSDRKSKFTASVKRHLVDRLDKRAAKLKLNRSDAVEEAIELWLRAQAEQDEEAYFSAAAQEMNTDAKDWNATTTRSSRRKWE